MLGIEPFKKFADDDEGVALVEFALLTPLMLLSFFTVVEFSRLFFSYQGAVSGVRDATRYMARTQPADVCVGKADDYSESYGTQTSRTVTYTDALNFYRVVFRNMDTEDATLLPANVTLDWVKPSFYCEASNTGTPYRQPLVPMAQIEAQFTVTLPLFGILELNGQPVFEAIDHIVKDQSRIYGF